MDVVGVDVGVSCAAATLALLLRPLLLFLVSSSIFTLVASYQMAAAQLTFLTFVYTFVVVRVVVV